MQEPERPQTLKETFRKEGDQCTTNISTTDKVIMGKNTVPKMHN